MKAKMTIAGSVIVLASLGLFSTVEWQPVSAQDAADAGRTSSSPKTGAVQRQPVQSTAGAYGRSGVRGRSGGYGEEAGDIGGYGAGDDETSPGDGYGGDGYRRRGAGIPTFDAAIRDAVRKLQAAEDEREKEEAKKKMSALLVTYFDADMKSRETEIAKIEDRVRNLRIQLDKRRAAKDDIIQLQLKVLENEAEGLGFFGQRAAGGSGNPNPWVGRRR